MVTFTSLVQSSLIALSCAVVCNGAPVESTPNKVVPYTFDVRRANPLDYNLDRGEVGDADISKRHGKNHYVKAPLKNKHVYYEAELEIGSKLQKNRVLFDTGSSDLWVIASDAECIDVECKKDGTYSLEDSSTGKNLSESLQIIYADGAGANGSYVSDTVKFGKAIVKNQQFGLAETSTSKFGVLGIGFPPLEATENGTTYDNFPINLKKQGYIKKIAFSLYLNSFNSTTGSILFGGVDHAKHEGELTELPIVEDNNLAVDFNSVVINGETFSNKTLVILDSGLGYTDLPLNIVNGIGKQIGGRYNSTLGGYLVDCQQNDNLTFNFPKNVSISAPISNFLYPLDVVTGEELSSNECFLGIKDDQGYGLLGENFLRSAYVKYDLEDRTIALAQVKYTAKSSIEEL